MRIITAERVNDGPTLAPTTVFCPDCKGPACELCGGFGAISLQVLPFTARPSESSVRRISRTIEFDLPPPGLSPNGRKHHMTKARLTASVRETARVLTRHVFGPNGAPEGSTITIAPVYVLSPGHRGKGYAPDDDDNAAAALKAYRDGIADALRVDDRTFTQRPPVILRGKAATGRPRLEITVEIVAPEVPLSA